MERVLGCDFGDTEGRKETWICIIICSFALGPGSCSREIRPRLVSFPDCGGTEVNQRGLSWSLTLTFQNVGDFQLCYEYWSGGGGITSTTLGNGEGEKTERTVFHGK